MHENGINNNIENIDKSLQKLQEEFNEEESNMLSLDHSV